jgi:hypothetical protein
MKYKLTEETTVQSGVTLHRILRLADNTLGGFTKR